MKLSLTLMMSALAAVTATEASATVYIFDLSGSRLASFKLDSNAPSFSSAYQSGFQNVSGTFGGSPGVASSISFGAVSFINSLDISGTSLGFAQFGGPLLFTGPSSKPVFTTGTFALSGIVSGNSTLTISEAGAVPEPAEWGLLISGFALLGSVARRRRATQVIV